MFEFNLKTNITIAFNANISIAFNANISIAFNANISIVFKNIYFNGIQTKILMKLI